MLVWRDSKRRTPGSGRCGGCVLRGGARTTHASHVPSYFSSSRGGVGFPSAFDANTAQCH